MKQPSAVFLMAALAASAGSAFSRALPVGPRLAVTLRVVNEGGVPPSHLVAAEKEAVRVFHQSGIDLIWLACEPGSAESVSGPAEFWVRIVTRRPSAASADMLGFTELYEHQDERQGSGSSGIYYPAAVELARRGLAPIGAILGAAIAHEVGHLLLGANAHFYYGVMFAHWGRPEFERIAASELNFAPEQARLLREKIEERFRRGTPGKTAYPPACTVRCE